MCNFDKDKTLYIYQTILLKSNIYLKYQFNGYRLKEIIISFVRVSQSLIILLYCKYFLSIER